VIDLSIFKGPVKLIYSLYGHINLTGPWYLIEEFSKLSVGECYVILPEKSVRAAKTQTPKAEVPSKNAWFMETACEGKSIDEKQVSDDLPLAGETKSTSKQKRLPKDHTEPNKNKEHIRDIGYRL